MLTIGPELNMSTRSGHPRQYGIYHVAIEPATYRDYDGVPGSPQVER